MASRGGRHRDGVHVPGINDDASPVHPVVRAVVALALGVGLGAIAAMFIPRRRTS